MTMQYLLGLLNIRARDKYAEVKVYSGVANKTNHPFSPASRSLMSSITQGKEILQASYRRMCNTGDIPIVEE